MRDRLIVEGTGTRRRFTALALATLFSRCAEVPDIGGLTSGDIGLGSREHLKPAQPLTQEQALQRQYDLQRTLSAVPIVPGNNVKLLSGGAETYAAMFAALQAATSSINLEYFILGDVESEGVHLSDILLDRLRAGVVVNVVYDAYGSAGTPAAFFAGLRSAGATIVEFNPIDPLRARAGWAPNHRDHRKIMVVDGRVGFTGGINLDKAYENPPSAGVPRDGSTSKAYWRDTAVRIEGPAVGELQKLFFGTWREQKAPPVAPANYFPPLPRVGVQTIRIIGSSPSDQAPLYYASLITAINSARSRIWLCSGYFVPPHQEREALRNAARAGVDVRIVTPAFSDVQSAVYAARASYGDLLEVGAHIYEMQDAVVHAKIAVIDDEWTVIGSSNLDRRSIVFNNEVDAAMIGRDIAKQVEGVLRQYMDAAQPVDLTRWQHRSAGERFDELKARIWQYWM